MLKTYKFIHSEESKVYLTSDSHFCHSKLIEQRSFKSIQEHDETLINNWNNLVRPQDRVIHCGDFVLGAGNDSQKVCESLFRRLNGHITMIFGNHISGIKQIYKECINLQYHLNPEELEIYPITWENKVTFVGDSMLAHIKVANVENRSIKQNYFVFCSHFAHRIWIDCQKGVLHASAHSHSSDKESNPDYKFARRLDVGVDNFDFKPISFDLFLRIMNTKTQPVLDHHTKETNPSF